LADLRFQSCESGDYHWQHDSTRFRDVLVAGRAAGFQAKDRHHRQSVAFPIGDRVAGRAGQWADQRNLVDAKTSVQISPHGSKLAAAYRRVYLGLEPAMDAAHRLPARVVRGGYRRTQAREEFGRSEFHSRIDCGDRLPVDRRPDSVDRSAGEKRYEDAAGRRTMAAK